MLLVFKKEEGIQECENPVVKVARSVLESGIRRQEMELPRSKEAGDLK